MVLEILYREAIYANKSLSLSKPVATLTALEVILLHLQVPF